MNFLRNRDELKQDDKIIALMGPTGCGKSKIIDNLTGSTDWSGSTLKSFTQKVRWIRTTCPHGASVVLVDTPGFDDTERPDTEILGMIGEWLEQTYKAQVKLTGILYLHRITDNRMSGTPHRNLHMFGKLCGDQPAKKVVFVTTMWDKISREQKARPKEREAQLKEKYLRPMLDQGAIIKRSDNTPEGAWEIICGLTHSESETLPVLLQEEMVHLHRSLNETEAAKTLYNQLQVLLSDHKATIDALLKEAKKSNNPKTLASLEADKTRIQSELDKTFDQVRKLKISLPRRIGLWFAKKPKGEAVNFSG